MKKSEPQSKQEPSKLADEISRGLLPPSSSPAAVSVSPPSNESQPSGEIQRIGNLTFQKWAWSAVWIHDESAVRMKLGGELVQVQVKGRWEPPLPLDKSPQALPSPHHGESHQSYFLRLLALYKGKAHPREHLDWIASRRWVGEGAKDLRDAIAAGEDLPTRSWAFVKEKPL